MCKCIFSTRRQIDGSKDNDGSTLSSFEPPKTHLSRYKHGLFVSTDETDAYRISISPFFGRSPSLVASSELARATDEKFTKMFRLDSVSLTLLYQEETSEIVDLSVIELMAVLFLFPKIQHRPAAVCSKRAFCNSSLLCCQVHPYRCQAMLPISLGCIWFNHVEDFHALYDLLL